MLKAISAALAMVLLVALEFSVAADVDVETILSDLEHPTGLAVRPGGAPDAYELFVVESGAAQVWKTSSSTPHAKVEIIKGLPATKADEPSSEHSNHALLFLDEHRFVVGIEGAPPDVRLFELKDDTPLTVEQAAQKVAPEFESNADAPSGRCIGLARTRANDVVADMLLVALRGDEQLNGVWKLPVRAGMISTMSRLSESSGVVGDEQTALSVSEQGYLLIAARTAAGDKPSLVFANPTNGQAVLSIETSLSEIVGLAYSPKSGQLYALAAKEGAYGLFRIDDASKSGEPAVSESKVVDISRPTTLAFGPDGALYVTSRGDEGADSKSGALLRITADL